MGVGLALQACWVMAHAADKDHVRDGAGSTLMEPAQCTLLPTM